MKSTELSTEHVTDPSWSRMKWILVFVTKICTRDILNYPFQLLLSSHHIYLTCKIYEERTFTSWTPMSLVCDFCSPHNCSFYLPTTPNSSVKSSMRHQAKENDKCNTARILMESKEELPVNSSKPANIYLSLCLLFSSFDC